MEDPASLFDPKFLFEHFANSRGTMGFEEFNNIFVQLNIKINHARMLQIFSAADIEKRGELRFLDFKRTLSHLKNFLIQEIMEHLNLSVIDMAFAFSFSISILLLMLAFIFVGIQAFAPISSFSSVTNSIMPLAAGLAVYSNKEIEKKQEELAAKADEKFKK